LEVRLDRTEWTRTGLRDCAWATGDTVVRLLRVRADAGAHSPDHSDGLVVNAAVIEGQSNHHEGLFAVGIRAWADAEVSSAAELCALTAAVT
jgi:hypothetical protein